MAVAVVLFCVSGGIGLFFDSLLAARLKEDSGKPPHPLERALLALGLGFAGTCYAVWILAWVKLAAPVYVLASLTALAVCLRRRIADWIKLMGSALRDIPGTLKSLPKGFRVFLFSVAACLVFQEMIANHAPTLERDDLAYHLYIPKSVSASGSLAVPAFAQRQSFYLLMTHMAFLPVMAVAGELGAKAVNFMWWLVLPLLLLSLARRMGIHTGAGVIGALCLAASPIVLYLGETCMADMVIAYFVLAGLLALLIFRDTKARKFLFYSAVLTAFAMTKFPAWPYGLATLTLFILQAREMKHPLWLGISCYLLAAAGILFPQALWLWQRTGNPFYPLSLFSLPGDSIETAAQLYLNSSPKGLAAFWNYLWNLWPNAYHLSDGPILLMAPLFLLVPSVPRCGLALAALWSLIPFVLGFARAGTSGVIPRYMLAAHGVWIMLAVAVWWEQLYGGPWRRRFFLGFLAAGLLVPCLAVSTLRMAPPLKLHLGLDSAESYLRKFYPAEGWDTVRFVNALPEAARVAVLDHHFAPYHYRDQAGFLQPVSLEVLQEDSPERILAWLREERISHVLFVEGQWRPLRTSTGIVWNAVYMGPYVQCRWWSQTPTLPFLKGIFHGRGAILFLVE